MQDRFGNRKRFSKGRKRNPVKLPDHPHTKFDEELFIALLAGSVSLRISEKIKILKGIERLNQYQVEELMKILIGERHKFAEFSVKYGGVVGSAREKSLKEWREYEKACATR